MRWSARSQELLCEAISDAGFVQRMMTACITVEQLQYWSRHRDVPITFRSIVRGALEDWAYQRDVARGAAGLAGTPVSVVTAPRISAATRRRRRHA